ncbi:peptidoglycan/LPS O-acetylase OafA/YrhL [Amycolatopsis bartoniae]|uniref:Acyltransferase n=1 Tax=Amycolatopsis bartoniae TaxID=941986 RepID=A0A8H9IR17_9PSEU|nr:acyltransferase [Amycolatopsis bartoniae]MBB2939564.1 peptidoglycan/LPS O-acetylase OafA/YrhL [Amycolatopsis bartoniae]GHF39239.1 acyltransferase [Amycolatopsis bartoniae]
MSGRGEHLHYVDVVRVLTVGLVIGTHVLALAPVEPTVLDGALGMVFHVSREVFFLLTAFVLTYSTGRKKVRWPRFWRRRFLFVAVPYLVWTVLYFFANGAPFLGANLVQQLLTGTARYHLYFLLVSMQIYLVFPLVRALLRATQRWHGALLAVAAAFQLTFAYAVQQNWDLGPLSGWVHAPDALLPSYLGYVLAGAIAAWHREALVAWTRQHVRTVFAGCAALVALSVVVYLVHVDVLGQPPLQASMVFQPVVAAESVAVAWAFLAAGLLWQETSRPGEKVVRATSDASFGIYLLHPLVLQGALLGATAAGLVDFAQTVPNAVVLAVLVLVLLPLLYLVSGLVTAAARRTPVSLALTGRARARRARPVPARPREDLALANSGGAR